MTYLTEPEARRFESKYVVNSSGCWVWQGSLDKDGYGSFYLRGANRRAHRVGWFSVHGPIPSGMVANHTCMNRACVNPQHLNTVTAKDNALKNSRTISTVNAQKTHCPEGHPYDGTEPGHRICTQCRRKKQAAAKKRRYHSGKGSLSV